MVGRRRSTGPPEWLICVICLVGFACFVTSAVSDGVLSLVAGLLGWVAFGVMLILVRKLERK